METPVRILVVDDRDENRAALHAVLASLDYTIVEARSGVDALKRLIDGEYAALLVDVVMPDMSGFELAELVRARERTLALPIVFLTAHVADDDMLHRGYRAGAIDFLSKPFSPDIVRAKVTVLAQLYRQRKQLEDQAARERELGLFELQLASERHYRNLAEAVPNIVWMARPDGEVDYFNRRWYEYTGLSIERAGGSWTSATHPDDRDRSEAAWRHALETGELLETECRLRRADSVYRWQLCRGVPERGAGGAIINWLGSFTDVHDARRASAQLVEFKATLDAVLDAVTIFDPSDLRLQYANEGASTLLGYAHGELLDVPFVDCLADYDERKLRQTLAPLIVGTTPSSTIETRFRRRDRGTVAVEVSLQLIRIDDSSRIVAIARDITERTRVRLERELLYREAVDAIRARDEFLSVASHELRTPLSALQLQVEMLLHPQHEPSPSLPEPTKSGLEMAARQVDRLSRLIKELLDVSRIRGGRLHIEPERVDLVAIARDVIERFAGPAANAHCTVTLDAPEPVIGTWDRLRIDQVITNLLSNAFKFGAGHPIEVSVGRDDGRARLKVTDHGIGIAGDDAARIFKRYEQAVSARTYGGLGLGLYIVSGIVEAHGGGVLVESEPNKGATFTVELPPESSAEEAHDTEHDGEGRLGH